jgi:hypothetical protein
MAKQDDSKKKEDTSRRTLSIREGSGGGKYEVVDPHSNYCGKSYSEWTTDWMNWFLSAHADKRNSGPVVFLRSHGLPNSFTGAFNSNLPNQVSATDTSPDSHSTDPDYPTIYVNDPNIRIGGDKLQIFEDQAVFIPIITAYGFASIVKDWGYLQDYTGLLIDNGDNPPGPAQLTINNKKIEPPLEMKDFRITTPIFTAVVPDAPYGTSIKDFLEDGPIAPGNYPAMVDGYFVMLKFPSTSNSYWVHSWASAGREAKGSYFSELLYEIEVLPMAKRHGMISTRYPAQNEGVINRILSKKKEIGEFTNAEVDDIKSIQDNVKKNLIPSK